jgi:chemotaxis protein histidine kinase CheA
MNLNINSLSNGVIHLKQQLLSHLTEQQKRIALIVGASLSALTLIYLINRCFCQSKKVELIDPNDAKDDVQVKTETSEKNKVVKEAKKVDATVKKAKKTEQGSAPKKVEKSKEEEATEAKAKEADRTPEKQKLEKAEKTQHSEEAKQDQEAEETNKVVSATDKEIAKEDEAEELDQKVTVTPEETLNESNSKRQALVEIIKLQAQSGVTNTTSETKKPETEDVQVEAGDDQVKSEQKDAEEIDAEEISDEQASEQKTEETAKQPQKSALEIEAANDPVKQKILDDYTPQMVEALGGFEKFMSFPTLQNWTPAIKREELTGSVMVGNKEGKPFIVFCYRIRGELKESGEIKVSFAFKSECFERSEEGWTGANGSSNELNFKNSKSVKEGSLEEKYLLDRIRRLMNYETVGRLNGCVKGELPKDAYLQGEDLEHYMNLDLGYYERKPEEGTTDIFLWKHCTQQKEQKEQAAFIQQKFQNQGNKIPATPLK